jgi:hypothetical protein
MTFHDIARGCCSDLQLDQLLLDELTNTERILLQQHLAESPSCQARLDELTRAREAYQALALAPLQLPAPSLATVHRLHPRWLGRASIATTAMAASIAGALWLQPTTPETRIKGQAVVLDVRADSKDVFAQDELSVGTQLHLSTTTTDGYVAVGMLQGGRATLIDGSSTDLVLGEGDASLLAISCASPPADREQLVVRAVGGQDVNGCVVDRMQIRVRQ